LPYDSPIIAIVYEDAPVQLARRLLYYGAA
jgi:hypothetical protein